MYLSYNKNGGGYEEISDAEAVLYDDKTGDIIGRFERKTERLPGLPTPGVWVLDYAIPCTEDENTVSVDVKYRLEVSVPGEKKIVSRTTFQRTIPKKAIIQKESPKEGWLQTSNLESPVWLMPDTYEITEPLESSPLGDSPSSFQPSWLYQVRNSYPMDKADPFNVSSDKGGHVMAVRLNGTSFKEEELPCGFLFPEVVEIEGHNHYFSSTLIVASVSEDYDKYIRSVIVDAMHHSDKDDVFAHLNEDQIYSNVENGLGIFGVQFVACLSNDLRPVIYQY